MKSFWLCVLVIVAVCLVAVVGCGSPFALPENAHLTGFKHSVTTPWGKSSTSAATLDTGTHARLEASAPVPAPAAVPVESR